MVINNKGEELMQSLEKFRCCHVLFVDDDPLVRGAIDFTLREIFAQTFLASSGEEALQICKKVPIDLIITDIEMPGMNGVDFITNIRKVEPFLPVIILSAHTNEEYLLRCVNLPIQAYIVKPITSLKLRQSLREVSNYVQERVTISKMQLTQTILYDKSACALEDLDKGMVALKKKEKLLLDLLLKNKNSIVSYETIEEVVWSDHWEVMSSDALRTVVKNLRKKVGKELIENISGQGYRFSI